MTGMDRGLGGRWTLVLTRPRMARTRMRDDNHTVKIIKVSCSRLPICLMEMMFQYPFQDCRIYNLIETSHSYVQIMHIFSSN